MPFRDDPFHHAAKLEDLVGYYQASKADAQKAQRRLRRNASEHAARVAQDKKSARRQAIGLLVWTIGLAWSGGGLLAWSASLHAESSTHAPHTPAEYCVDQIEYEREVCAETVAREVDTQRAADDEFDREIQHALHAYQALARQMPTCFPFIPSRGDPNVLTETLPSGVVVTYTRDDGVGE